MFEHLGPVPETTLKKRLVARHYWFFLLIALMIFTVTASTVTGPQVGAYVPHSTQVALLASKNLQKQIVPGSRTILFDFVLQTQDSGVALDKIRLQINGKHSDKAVEQLKLYHDGTQLGTTIKIEDRYAVIDVLSYPLTRGDNHFYVGLDKTELLDPGNSFEFVLSDRADISLLYDGYNLLPVGNFPFQTSVRVVANGYAIVKNNLFNNQFYTLNKDSYTLADFNLSASDEIADLYSINLSYDDSEADFSASQFSLLDSQGKFITTGVVDTENSQIIFDLPKNLVIKNDGLDFVVYAENLPTGNHSFYLGLEAKGYVSGQDLSWESMLLSRIFVRDRYLQMEQVNVGEKLQNGWNTLYSLDLQAKGGDVYLDKLSWRISTYDTAITDIKVMIDGDVYNTGIKYNEDDLNLLFSPSLELSQGSHNLKLLVLTEDTTDESYIQAYLLTDGQQSRNILWHDGEGEYNGYVLPELPLGVSILE